MLRTDLIKTRTRETTRVIAVRETITKAKDDIDATVIDERASRQGRFGVGVHFLVLTSGDLQLCRDIETIGSHTRHLDEISVAVGVVGGLDEDGKRSYTRTPEQEEAISEYVEFLSQRYPDARVDDDPHGFNTPS